MHSLYNISLKLDDILVAKNKNTFFLDSEIGIEWKFQFDFTSNGIRIELKLKL